MSLINKLCVFLEMQTESQIYAPFLSFKKKNKSICACNFNNELY